MKRYSQTSFSSYFGQPINVFPNCFEVRIIVHNDNTEGIGCKRKKLRILNAPTWIQKLMQLILLIVCPFCKKMLPSKCKTRKKLTSLLKAVFLEYKFFVVCDADDTDLKTQSFRNGTRATKPVLWAVPKMKVFWIWKKFRTTIWKCSDKDLFETYTVQQEAVVHFFCYVKKY